MDVALFWQIANLAVFVVYLILLYYLASGAPYLPSSHAAVDAMVRLANVRQGMRVADLGSGDGRIIIAFAKAGAEAHGYEINPILVWLSRRKITRAGVQDRCFVHTSNFWKTDFSMFDVVTLFGISHIMKRLEKRLKRDLKPDAIVLSHIFTFPAWACERQDENTSVRLYLQKEV